MWSGVCLRVLRHQPRPWRDGEPHPRLGERRKDGPISGDRRGTPSRCIPSEGAWRHISGDMVVPPNLRLGLPPPYSPELNPVEPRERKALFQPALCPHEGRHGATLLRPARSRLGPGHDPKSLRVGIDGFHEGAVHLTGLAVLKGGDISTAKTSQPFRAASRALAWMAFSSLASASSRG